MNIARWFSYTLEIERQNTEKAERIRSLEDDVRKLTDAALTSRGGKPAFREPEQSKPFDMAGQYTPAGHPSRRPVVQPDAELSEEERGQLRQFKRSEA